MPYANFVSANFITAIFETFHKYLPYANFELFISLVQKMAGVDLKVPKWLGHLI